MQLILRSRGTHPSVPPSFFRADRCRPSRALIDAAEREKRTLQAILVSLKNADPAERNAILDSISLDNGVLRLPDSLNDLGHDKRPPKQSGPPSAQDDRDGLTPDERQNISTFISRDECGVVRIFGPTSALHIESPTSMPDSTESRATSDPDRFQLIANAALQRQKEHDLRKLPTIGGIPSELAMHLLDLHWNRQHHTFHLTGGPYCSEFLLNAVFACSSKFSERIEVREDPDRPETAGKRFFDRCDELLAQQNLLQSSSIPTVTGLLMLGSTFNARGMTSKGWLYTGYALRMVYDLGLHLDCKEVAGNAEDIEIRRRVFWGAFICDKLQSLYFGRPFTIQLRDTHVSWDFMDTFEENELWTPYVDPTLPTTRINQPTPIRLYSISTFQQLCSLSRIMTSIIDHFYVVGATPDKTRAHLDYMDEKLLTWYKNLPSELRFEPWAQDSSSSNGPTMAAPNGIILLTTYHALLILLHRPFITNGPAHSWERCVTAARNITSLALAYQSAYSLRRANYMLSYAVYVACTIHARNPAVRESTQRGDPSSPLTVCLRCLDELAVPNCGVSAPAKIIRRLMEANGIPVGRESVSNVGDSFPLDVDLSRQMFPETMLSPSTMEQQPFIEDLDLLFGFMQESADI
ncbi:Nitrogen assimilation transcription factor NirA [Rasamsonia emersonii CBS 393.64]|uniref:Nitrogen assimilation transcription factor NirA n=1 Tax=Rasamsonia emersonii (strain ATCC 16479 / CBS 393.64 / IMI 116815) TaxID=1408163 RepID=A0A0F4YDG3_RASE3|nr:Nitrogen assimilation transcription factor NirA [Rasamsonia emersonii CBS 393.64]KKA16125.1 Nitrogen assimilation transcription factor NirA [Rasamsonia emersonii CBS 393.64]